LSEKQTQQHRQHFNLSDETKQKLEELTARRYPGRQRRQSQLVEDLIMEAFEKERGMSTVSTGGVQEPEPGGLAPATREALDLAQQEARRLKAAEVSPEHLLLGLAEQGDSMTMRSLTSMRLDVPTLRDLLSGEGEQVWRTAEEDYKNNELLKARVIDYNKGGLIVDVSGMRGFVPISQILNMTREEVASGTDDLETEAKLQGMVGKGLQLKIIEINRARKRLILSERLAEQEWRQRRREELLDELKPGEVRKGVVSTLANFGAFVDLGGAEGLVQISQLAWSRVNHPSEVLKVGQEVEVQVLSVDKEKKKIALSIKRAEVDPWITVGQRYAPGQVVTGTITKIAPFGVFARIEDGIEGIIHLSELIPGLEPQTFLHEGQQVQLRILRIDAERRRLGLSMRQVDEPDSIESPIQAAGAETVTMKIMGETIPVRLEATPPGSEEEASTETETFSENLPLSAESQECLLRASSIAKRMGFSLVQPNHLLWGILLINRIRDALTASRPLTEILNDPTVIVGFTEDEQTRLSSCPFCGRSVQPHWKHCVYCGKSLARVCPKCGTPRAEAEGVRFCFECGSPLE
jgi:predicted RNA-binding protein with RPS1 domain